MPVKTSKSNKAKPKTATKKVSAKKKGKKTAKATSPFAHVRSWLFLTLIIFVAAILLYFAASTVINKYSFQIRARFGDIVYPSGDVRGIDISHHQGEIDWSKLRNSTLNNSPIRFIFIKATEGTNLLDENFNQNFFYCRKNGIVRGAYHFFTTTSDAIRQAKYYCKMVQLEDDDMAPILDVEQKGNLSKQQLQQAVLKWLQYVEKHYGVKPILYTSVSFKKSYLDSPEFDQYPLWLAHYYVPELKYKGKWCFWQHSDRGKVDGIDEKVDVDVFNGKYEDMMRLTVGEGEGNS